MKRLLTVLLALLLAMTTLSPLTVNAAAPGEQAVALESVSLSNWMSAIRGETNITEITVPGTHDSCARKFKQSYVDFIAKCQSLNITEQLNAGVRFLDVRCEVDSSTHSVKTVHGSVDCWNGNDYYYLDFLFQDVYNWLDAHPTESVFLMIKEDDGNVGAPTFTSAIYEYIHGYGQNKYFYGEDYDYHDYWYLDKTVPTLNEVRGKIVLFNRFDRYIASSGSTASEEESGQKIKYDNQESSSLSSPNYVTGQDWSSGAKYHVQDMYKLSTDDKLTAVQENLSLGHYRGEYYLNFTSTTTSDSIPRPENYANTINPAFLNLTFDKRKPSGYIPMDFIAEAQARKIVENNEAVSNLVTGTDGNVSYVLNRMTGTLTVSGSGAMNDYAPDSNSGVKGTGTTAPWSDQVKNCLFSGQYNTDIVRNIVVNDGITYIGNYAFYGFDHLESVSLPSGVTMGTEAVPSYVSTDYFSINAKTGNSSKSAVNPFAGKDLSGGITIEYTQKCDTDRGWNNALMTFTTGNNSDNRYFIIMTNGTILFNDGNGGIGGGNNCYFDLNSSSEVNTTGQGWVDIKILIYKDSFGEHRLDYYINGTPAKQYNLSQSCASGYPVGISGSDGIFSFLSSRDIKLYYGAAYNIYNMGGTTECYLDKVRMLSYIESDITSDRVYYNTFTDSLGAEPHTGTQDGGYSVYHQTTDNDGRSGTIYLPYSGTNEATTNYASVDGNPFVGVYNGYTIGFWQRINGNYWDNRQSITFAQGDIAAKKYFTIGTDGYLRFNNGNGGNDPSLTNAGLYFDYTTPCSAIVKQQWQYITVEVVDDLTLRYYVNGALKNTVTVTGTDNYLLTGGLMSFLRSADTTMYFGSYTPYWGTATLSLDNVSCFNRALTNEEVAALYASEAGDGLLEDAFLTAPERVSGSITHLDRYDGRDGVLYIPTCSADGDIRVYVDGVQTTNLAHIAAGSEIRLEYGGDGTVAQWRIITAEGTQTSADSTYTFILTENTRVDVQLTVAVTMDTSALEAAIAYGKTFNKGDYSDASYAALVSAVADGNEALSATSQLTIDNATQAILTAVNRLVPYLVFTLSDADGGTVSATYDGLLTGQATGKFTPLFGTEIRLTAVAAKSYQFAGWYETKTHRLLSTDAQYSFVISSNTEVKPLFDYYGSSVLTFTYGDGYIVKRVAKTPEQWAQISSLASLCPTVPYHYGGVNGHWDYDNAAVLAQLTAGENAALHPAYTEQATATIDVPVPEEEAPVLTLSVAVDETADVGSYLMALGVPDGCVVVEKGIAFKYGSADSFDPSSIVLTLDNKTVTSKFNTAEHNGTYVVNARRFSRYAWAARAYCTYYDSDGVLSVAYSDQVNVG